MASQSLTEYERKRLENIKRNDEMMASLKLQSRALSLSSSSSSSTKRNRTEKVYKTQPEKKPRSETPVVMRRSLRTQGIPPDRKTAKGLEDDLASCPVKTPILSKFAPQKLGHFTMEDAYVGASSMQSLVDSIMDMTDNAPLGRFIKKEVGRNGGLKIETSDETAGSIKAEENESSLKDLSVNAPLRDLIKREIDGDLKKEIEDVSDNASMGGSVKREQGSCSVKKISNGTPLQGSVKKEVEGNRGCLSLGSMVLKEKNVARVMPGRIMNVKFFPCADKRMVVAGNKFGDVTFWDADCKDEDDGIFLYHPHTGPISGIVIQPYSLSKVITSCYDGFIRLMDVEKESFDLVHSSDATIFSLSQRTHDASSLYFGEGRGLLNVWDVRVGKSSSSWMLHDLRINTIDFNLENPNLMVTSSTDGTARIWDLRRIDADGSNYLRMVDHGRAVYSAYFSPSGKCLATTSISDEVGISSGVDFMDTSMIYHNNQTGRWISTFRAIWGWDDSYLFVGNMGRGVDVISAADKKTVVTLESSLMTAITCRFAAHPYKVGTLAAATSGGQIYLWTST